ncbi:hypothetical protein BLAT2472_170027 [Burkholderia latens]|uniref:hypothetical protein n=1 Tax=Burkholderia latens TaxID=488446 RepID=UPI0039A57EA1
MSTATPAKTIMETMRAVCRAAPRYVLYRTVQTAAVWSAGIMCFTAIYLGWTNGATVGSKLWALLTWQDTPAVPIMSTIGLLLGAAFVACVIYEVAKAAETRPAISAGNATDDLLLAIVQNPHIPASAKERLASELADNGCVSEAALAKIAVRADMEAEAQRRQAEIESARRSRQLGPGAIAMLNYHRQDDSNGN